MFTRSDIEIGERFGSLEVLNIESIKKRPAQNGRFIYTVTVKCLCRCGKEVLRDKKALRAGDRNHCGNIECKRRRMRSV